MGSLRLADIPTELLHYICLFLPEEDIVSLSQTCLHHHLSLNANLVWKRFVTEEVRRLKTRKQQLDPPLELDPSLCEDRQHVLRKIRLLSNWRNGRFAQYSAAHGINPRNMTFIFHQFYRVKSYKENYLFTKETCTQGSQVWDISKTPVVCQTVEDNHLGCLIGDYSVLAGERCRVDVYQLNIEENTFLPRYSFSVVDDEIVNEIVPHAQSECCHRWSCAEFQNYLIFNQRSAERCYPVVHIWDVVNARKVGAFVSPKRCRYLDFYTFDNNCMFFKTVDGEESFLLKLDMGANMFTEAAFKSVDGILTFNRSFDIIHKDHCIKMVRQDVGDDKSIKVEVCKFNTSVMIADRLFQKACYNLQHKKVIDGKLVIFTSECFHVVDALSLETVAMVPHQPDVHCIMCQTSVFGSIFLVTVESDGVVKIWDIENGSSILLPQDKLDDDLVNYITWVLENRSIIYGEEPMTKFVIYGKEKMFVTNFW